MSLSSGVLSKIRLIEISATKIAIEKNNSMKIHVSFILMTIQPLTVLWKFHPSFKDISSPILKMHLKLFFAQTAVYCPRQRMNDYFEKLYHLRLQQILPLPQRSLGNTNL